MLPPGPESDGREDWPQKKLNGKSREFPLNGFGRDTRKGWLQDGGESMQERFWTGRILDRVSPTFLFFFAYS
jgi:hypothetical protein